MPCPFCWNWKYCGRKNLLTTNYVRDVWKSSCDFIKPRRTHLPSEVCVCLHFYTQNFCSQILNTKSKFKICRIFIQFEFKKTWLFTHYGTLNSKHDCKLLQLFTQYFRCKRQIQYTATAKIWMVLSKWLYIQIEGNLWVIKSKIYQAAIQVEDWS
jgi:hypothetical protein